MTPDNKELPNFEQKRGRNPKNTLWKIKFQVELVINPSFQTFTVCRHFSYPFSFEKNSMT